MSKLTFEEIKEIINSDVFEEHDHDPSSWMQEDVYTSLEELNSAVEKYGYEYSQEFKDEFAKLGQFKQVDHFGGEGKGDEYYTVYHFIDHGIYISFNGWYASHHGSEYSDMSQVKSKIVEKTEWEAVK